MPHLLDVFLLYTGGNCCEAVGRYGSTPLHVAVITGVEDHLVKSLCWGPDLGASGNRGQTALHMAASDGTAGMVKLLLEAGASPHARSESGSPPAYPIYRAARSWLGRSAGVAG